MDDIDDILKVFNSYEKTNQNLYTEVNELSNKDDALQKEINAVKEQIRSIEAANLGVDVITIGIVDHGAAKRPAGAGCHVDPHAETLRLAGGMAHHVDPFGREMLDVLILVALCAVYGDDSPASHAGFVHGLKVPGDVLLVHGAARPPPVGTGTVLSCRFRPVKWSAIVGSACHACCDGSDKHHGD